MNILYKYYPPSTTKVVLENNSIRFSPISEFNDPFESYVFPTTEFSLENFSYEVYLQTINVLEKKEIIEITEKSGPFPKLISLYQQGEFANKLDLYDFALHLALMLKRKKLASKPSEW